MKTGIIAALFLWCAISHPVSAQITPLQNNSSRENLFGSDGSARYYSINVPPGYGRLVVKTSSFDVGDCDVYLRLGSLPTTTIHDAASEGPGNNEEVIVSSPASGTWYIMLFAYSTYLSLHFEVLYDGTIDTNVSVGNKAWDVSLDGSMNSSPCLAPDGTIYAATYAGDLWAIQSNGTAKWHKYVGSVSATPALASDGTIYIVNESGQLIALVSSGTQKWIFSRKTHKAHPVALARDGTIYVPSNGNSLYAVVPDGSLKWQFAVESGYGVSAPPVIGSDGTIYCGFYHPNISAGILYAIRSDGTEKWRFNLPGKITSPAIDATGAIIFGSPAPVSKVYAVQSNGVKKWESRVAGGILSSGCYVYSAPVVSTDGTIYVSSNSRLTALSPSDGREKWHYDNNILLPEFDRANGPAVDSNGTIYFGSLGIFGAGDFYAIKPDGTLAWKYDVGGEVASPPIIMTNSVIFATANGSRKLYSLRTAGEPSQSVWPISRQNAANTASLEIGQTVTRPRLTISRNGKQIVFSWPATPGFLLESGPSPTSTIWTVVEGSPVPARNQYILATSPPPSTHFYRLRKP